MEPMTMPAMAPPLRLLFDALSAVVSGVDVMVTTTWRASKVLVGFSSEDAARGMRPARALKAGVTGAIVVT